MMAAALAACGSRSSGEAVPQPEAPSFEQRMREQISPVEEGLAEEHRGALPVLEREICIPAREHGDPPECHRDRVYADGARYLLTSGSWLPVRRVSPESMAALSELYGEVCDGTDPVFGNDDGSEIHLVNMDSCQARLVVTGIAAGRLAPLSRVPDMLNR